MNVLPFDKQSEIIAALTEGVSIRATERLTNVHRDTIMRLGARVGEGCAILHDQIMRRLRINRIEIDEAWSYVGKKQAKIVSPGEDPDLGDQYVFLAMAANSKAIISYRVGKRNAITTKSFMQDVRARVLGSPEFSTDAFQGYPVAIDEASGIDCSFGTIEKHYAVDTGVEAARRYSPAQVVRVSKRRVRGKCRHISTSYVERQNLTLRMSQKRFSRFSNGFSKRLTNHIAAVGLYVAHYNFCRVHETLRVTPAMQLGLTDHIWTVSELVDAALQDWHSEKVA